MKNQVNGNGKINNSQRQVLSKLAVEVLDKKIQQARDESGELVAQIREKVREELGVAAMDMEIAEMERRIRVLQKKKEGNGLFYRFHMWVCLIAKYSTLFLFANTTYLLSCFVFSG